MQVLPYQRAKLSRISRMHAWADSNTLGWTTILPLEVLTLRFRGTSTGILIDGTSRTRVFPRSTTFTPLASSCWRLDSGRPLSDLIKIGEGHSKNATKMELLLKTDSCGTQRRDWASILGTSTKTLFFGAWKAILGTLVTITRLVPITASIGDAGLPRFSA